MPMFRPSLTNNHIPRPNPSRFPAPITDPSGSHLYFEDLSGFVGVPECAGGGGEEDVVEHYFGGGGCCAVWGVAVGWEFGVWRC